MFPLELQSADNLSTVIRIRQISLVEDIRKLDNCIIRISLTDHPDHPIIEHNSGQFCSASWNYNYDLR